MMQTEGSVLNVLDKMICNVHEALTLFEYTNFLLQINSTISNLSLDHESLARGVPSDSGKSVPQELFGKAYKMLNGSVNRRLFAAHGEITL